MNNIDITTPAPLVSVCIPSFRGEAFIGYAIDSVLSQTMGDFELLVIDDNSDDRTASAVESFHDRRIRFLRNPENLGPEKNWNRCLDLAKGRYFKLLPQDDVLAPNCLEDQVTVLEADSDERIALVFCARQVVDTRGKILTSRKFPVSRSGMIPAAQVIRRCVRRGTNLIGEPGAVLFRKSLALKVGPFSPDARYVIDLDYWSRLLCYGAASYLPAEMAVFRVSRGSWSVAIGRSQSDDFLRYIDSMTKLPMFSISASDVFLGKLNARLNTVLRQIFYWYFL